MKMSEVTPRSGYGGVLSDLEEDGYQTEWGLFSAEETGAPHQRIRCFILAKIPDTNCPRGEVSDRREHASEQEPYSDGEAGGTQQQLGDTAKHGRGSRSPNTEAERVEREGEEGRLSELEGGCIQLWPARPRRRAVRVGRTTGHRN